MPLESQIEDLSSSGCLCFSSAPSSCLPHFELSAGWPGNFIVAAYCSLFGITWDLALYLFNLIQSSHVWPMLPCAALECSPMAALSCSSLSWGSDSGMQIYCQPCWHCLHTRSPPKHPFTSTNCWCSLRQIADYEYWETRQWSHWAESSWDLSD